MDEESGKKFPSPQAEIQHWREVAEKFKTELEEVKEEAEEYRISSQELEAELEAQLEDLESKNKDLAGSNGKLTTENELLREKINEIQQTTHRELSEMGDDLAQVQAYKDELQRYIRELEQANDDLERGKRSTVASLEEFEMRLNQAIERNAFLESERRRSIIIRQNSEQELSDRLNEVCRITGSTARRVSLGTPLSKHVISEDEEDEESIRTQLEAIKRLREHVPSVVTRARVLSMLKDNMKLAGIRAVDKHLFGEVPQGTQEIPPDISQLRLITPPLRRISGGHTMEPLVSDVMLTPIPIPDDMLPGERLRSRSVAAADDGSTSQLQMHRDNRRSSSVTSTESMSLYRRQSLRPSSTTTDVDESSGRNRFYTTLPRCGRPSDVQRRQVMGTRDALTHLVRRFNHKNTYKIPSGGDRCLRMKLGLDKRLGVDRRRARVESEMSILDGDERFLIGDNLSHIMEDVSGKTSPELELMGHTLPRIPAPLDHDQPMRVLHAVTYDQQKKDRAHKQHSMKLPLSLRCKTTSPPPAPSRIYFGSQQQGHLKYVWTSGLPSNLTPFLEVRPYSSGREYTPTGMPFLDFDTRSEPRPTPRGHRRHVYPTIIDVLEKWTLPPPVQLKDIIPPRAISKISHYTNKTI